MRRSSNFRGLVNWPEPTCNLGVDCELEHEAWHDTREGGMEAWLVLPWHNDDSECIAGVSFELASYDVIVSKHKFLNGSFSFSVVILLGSTGLCLWNKNSGYFTVSKDNLMPEGRALFDTIAKLFGREPQILTAIDT